MARALGMGSQAADLVRVGRALDLEVERHVLERPNRSAKVVLVRDAEAGANVDFSLVDLDSVQWRKLRQLGQ